MAKQAITMYDTPLPVSYAVILREVVNDWGGDGPALFDGTPLSEEALADPDGRCPASLLGELCRRALLETGKPALGLYFGRQLPLTAHGALGYALLSCRNTGQALEILMKYYRLLLGDAVLEFDLSGDRVHITYRAATTPLVNRRFDQEVFYAGLVAAIIQLQHKPLPDARFHFSYDEPDTLPAYREVLGEQLFFDTSTDAISLPRNVLDEPLEFANPAMLKLYQQQCGQMLDEMETRSGLAGQVRRYLLEQRRQFPSLEETADHFHLSSRTLRRRLAEEETRFQLILDEVRRELAERYLRDHTLSGPQVAELLQFSDFSNFRRAFLGWTGLSPATYRRQQIAKTEQRHSGAYITATSQPAQGN